MQHETHPGKLGFPAKPVLAAIAAAAGSTAAVCTDVLGAPALQSVTAVCDLHHVRDAAVAVAAGAVGGLLVVARRTVARAARSALGRMRAAPVLDSPSVR